MLYEVITVIGSLVEQQRGARDLAGRMVVVRDHVEQRAVALVGAAVAEKGLVHLRRVPGEGDVFGAVGRITSYNVCYTKLLRSSVQAG